MTSINCTPYRSMIGYEGQHEIVVVQGWVSCEDVDESLQAASTLVVKPRVRVLTLES